MWGAERFGLFSVLTRNLELIGKGGFCHRNQIQFSLLKLLLSPGLCVGRWWLIALVALQAQILPNAFCISLVPLP